LRYEYLFYLNTQVQMLKSFDSLLIQKFTVSAQGTSCQNFFSSPLYVRDLFFGTMVLCSNFFLRLRIFACMIFVFKITHPPTPLKENGWPLFQNNPRLSKVFSFSLVRLLCPSENFNKWFTPEEVKSWLEVNTFSPATIERISSK